MKTKAGLSPFTLSLIALVLMCGLAASAQDQVTQPPTTSAVPNLIRYGGVLKDANGAVLASQTLGVTFALYKQQEGGVALWTETRNVTTNAAGQYSVMLGSTKPEGVTADLFSEQEQRWLGVQVQGQPEQSRVLMVSVPYAFQAHEAETLGGLPASAFVKAPTTDSAAGTSTAVNALNSLANTAVASDKTSSGGILPPPAANVVNGPCFAPSGVFYIPIFANPAGSIICNSVIFQSAFGVLGPPGPNVGIGMVPVAPARLDVNGGTTEGINTSNNSKAYMIGYAPVLQITGDSNLFVGVNAGTGNTGVENTFSGVDAGNGNTGSGNTFSGVSAGSGNTGDTNTFTGNIAGANNTGSGNTMSGFQAGAINTGSENTFTGVLAGGSFANGGSFNTFTGYYSGGNNISGNGNVFFGAFAGYGMVSGSSNTFVGPSAGKNEATVSNNIEIGTLGPAPSNASNGSNTILIGTEGSHTDTYIAGIWGSATGGASDVVCVDANGKLWGAPFHADCTLSSRRFKEQIADMGDSTSKLLQLRPVTFFYKPQYDDGSHQLQYGLIAEEVAKVDPSMVAYDKEGQPYTVKYQLLAPMLLNEFQKQHAVVSAQQDEMTALREQTKAQQQQMLAQQREIEGLKSQLQLQSAAFQERLSRLESLVTTQMQTADKPAPATTTATGGLQ